MAPAPSTVADIDEWKHNDVLHILDDAAAAASKLKDGKTKNVKYSQAVESVRAMLESLAIDVPRAIKPLVFEYLDEAVESFAEENGGRPGIWRGQKWTPHSVVQHTYAEQCASRTDELASGANRGTQPWLAKYNTAVKDILEEMDDDEVAEVEAQVETWNKQGLDPVMQKKLRHKHMKKDIDNFANVFRKNYGASVGFVIMYRDVGSEDPTVIRHASAPVYAERSFWDHNSSMLDADEALAWAAMEFPEAPEDEEDLQGPVQKTARSRETYELELGDHGHRILPSDFRRIGDHKTRVNIIRTLIVAEFRLKEKYTAARTPWSQMAQNPQRYHTKDVMPDGIPTRDPMKYTSDQTTKILRHWFERQDRNLPPFVFSGSEYGRVQKEKKKAKWVEPNNDDTSTGRETVPKQKTGSKKEKSKSKQRAASKKKAAPSSDEESDEDESPEPSTSQTKKADTSRKRPRASSTIMSEVPASTTNKKSKTGRSSAAPEEAAVSGPAMPPKKTAPRPRPVKKIGVAIAPAPPETALAGEDVSPTFFKDMAKEAFPGKDVPLVIEDLALCVDRGRASIKICNDVFANFSKQTVFKTVGLHDPLTPAFHHNRTHFERFIKWFVNENYICEIQYVVCHDDWVSILQAVCRVYRDITKSMETEPGTPGSDGNLFQDSVLGKDELDELEEALKVMCKVLGPMVSPAL